jgi:GTP cyclohydrolase I
VLVVLEASHECVTMRGSRQKDATTVTIAARGELAEPAARAELVALIALPPAPWSAEGPAQ